MNIDKYKVAANITEYRIVTKVIFQRIIIYVKIYVKLLESSCQNGQLLGYNCRVATLPRFYITVTGIRIPSLKSKWQL